VQPALAVLGEFVDPASAELLEAWCQSDHPHRYEAALALGAMGSRASLPMLRALHADRSADVLVRTAAACAVLDLGDVRSSVPFLHAILCAGTPQGAATSEAHALPDKARWALERRIAIDAIRRHTGGEDYDLDPDSTWPRLTAAADRFRSAMQAEIEVGGSRR
jgi:HEAT repeat protein